MAMKLDPDMIRQLMLMFRSELDEQAQVITDGLLALEKGEADPAREAHLDAMFRAAHNIKGAARGVDVRAVASIAHSLETLISALRHEKGTATAQTISLCLLSLDRMREALAACEAQQPLAFDLQALLERLDGWREAATDAPPAPTSMSELADTITAPPVEAGPAALGILDEATPAQAPVAAVAREEAEMARIPVRKLDQVFALMEDLIAAKIEMEDHLAAIRRLNEEAHACARSWAQLAPGLKREGALGGAGNLLVATGEAINGLSAGGGRVYRQMRASSRRLGLITGALQDRLRMMRLVPVATLLRPLARSVRDISLELGKKVDYTVRGDDIEMDRPVLEGIKDPLVHLLRNAIDHGIEMPEARLASGKPETGRIDVTVSAQGNRIVITVSDDGVGIRAAGIATAAVKKKLLTAAEAAALSPSETHDLIFRTGFSSKEIITNVSGRGVGLDVVKSNLRKLKGNVRVDTTEGEGTCFTIDLPLTLSTDRGLMVRAGGAMFAIPSTAVERVMEIRASELVDIEASQAIVLEGEAIPLRELATVLELSQATPTAGALLPVVVIAKGWQRVALLVEEIVGEREIVIKRLKPPLLAIRNVAGGTLTGSGKVLMVLNPADLVTSALRLGAVVRILGESQDAAQAPRVLVVDDSITTRTLEKSILENQGYRVTVAVDGKLGWEAMQQEDFDLVITDVEMPVMNGFELAERIKGSEKHREIPVVIVTSLANEADRRRGIAVGADAYIVKGQFETKALLDVIDQLI